MLTAKKSEKEMILSTSEVAAVTVAVKVFVTAM